MNSRFIYIDGIGRQLSEWDLKSKMYVLDKETGEKIGFSNAGAYMSSDWDNANFFLPVLTDAQLTLLPGVGLRNYRFSNFNTLKRELLEPIYKQVGFKYESGLFPTVKGVDELHELVNYCIKKAQKKPVRKIGKYKISRR